MNDIRMRLLSFRSLLKYVLNSQENRTDNSSRLVYGVTKALLEDFDRMFDHKVLKRNFERILPLIEEHCFAAPNCPICGSEMYTKTGKYGVFNGCSKYPDCKGIRDEKGVPSVNDSLIFYLTGKLHEEKLKEDSADSRFKNLDL